MEICGIGAAYLFPDRISVYRDIFRAGYDDGDDFVRRQRICSDRADANSAITMRRSYKEPRTHEDAVKIIEEVAGTQLDRELVDVFLTIPKEELEKCIPEKVKN